MLFGPFDDVVDDNEIGGGRGVDGNEYPFVDDAEDVHVESYWQRKSD